MEVDEPGGQHRVVLRYERVETLHGLESGYHGHSIPVAKMQVTLVLDQRRPATPLRYQ